MYSRLTTRSLKIGKKVRIKSYKEIIESGYWKRKKEFCDLLESTRRLLKNYDCDIYITKDMIENWLGRTVVVRRIDDINHFRVHDTNYQFHITMVDLATEYDIE